MLWRSELVRVCIIRSRAIVVIIFRENFVKQICIFGFTMRPILAQSYLSVENALFRLKPKSGFVTQSKKSFFDSHFFD